MPFDAPFTLGPFLVDAEGRLAPRDLVAIPAFLVRWRGRTVRARLDHSLTESGALLLHIVLGRVPSTAGAADSRTRAQNFAVLRWLPRNLPAGWQLGLTPDHRVLLEARAAVPLPITATGLLAELTAFLVALAPYLDLLDEVGIARAAAPEEAGMAKT